MMMRIKNHITLLRERERDSQDMNERGSFSVCAELKLKLTPHPFPPHTVNSRAKRCGAAST